jgi:hypothetical protein
MMMTSEPRSDLTSLTHLAVLLKLCLFDTSKTITATEESRMYEGIRLLKRSWPAVSQSWSRTVRSSRYMVFERKSMPIVAE